MLINKSGKFSISSDLSARQFRARGALASLGVLAASIAFGQEGLQEVIVTGTRLHDTNLSSSSPVASMSEAEIAVSGSAVSFENLLNEMPQFVPSDSSTTGFRGDDRIIATANLRGLGPQRTLVLVDGKRWVPSTLAGYVDLNTVPTALVRRVEVITGGASAVYGSDAIAGVVNFILKDDFEGVEAHASSNITDAGDGMAWDAGLTTGGNFADGRGSAVLDLTYSKRDEILAAERDYARDQLADARCAPGTLDSRGVGVVSNAPGSVACFAITGSGTLPGGTINNSIIFDRDGKPITPRPPGLFDNFFAENYIQLPLERWTATTFGDYQLSENAELYSRFVYTSSESSRNQRGTSTSGSHRFRLNLDNPYVVPALSALLAPLDADADGIVDVSLARRFTETGPRRVILRQNAMQAQLGLRGSLSDQWSYDAFYQYGRNDRLDSFPGDIPASRLQQALLALRGVNGQPVCIDPSNGCVPANVFGEGNVSPEAAAFLETESSRSSEVIEQVAGAHLSGDTSSFLTLPAGPLSLVVGGEWRDVRANQRPDNVLQTDTQARAIQQPTEGAFSVEEVFGELQVPLLEDQLLAKSLTLKGAGRYSDYSLEGVGGVVTWNAGLVWEPTDGLRLRGEFQRAIRAPNVEELYQGRQAVTNNYVDPCSDRSAVASRTPEMTQLCIANGVPGSAVYGPLQPGSPEVKAESGGNPDLSEESTNTYTIGVTYEPWIVNGLSLSADYYNIEIEDAISFFGGGAVNTANLCYNVFRDANSIYCQAIERDPITGSIVAVKGDYANVSLFETSGVDIQVRWVRSLGFGFFGRDSQLSVSALATHVIDRTIQSEPAADILECVGVFGSRCGEPVPEWRVNTRIGWQSGPLGVNLQWRWSDAVLWDGQFTFANEALGRSRSFTARDVRGSRIESHSYFDVVGQWRFDDDIDLIVGIENLLDKDPPVVGDPRDGSNNTWPGTYDPFGRKFFASVRVGF